MVGERRDVGRRPALDDRRDGGVQARPAQPRGVGVQRVAYQVVVEAEHPRPRLGDQARQQPGLHGVDDGVLVARDVHQHVDVDVAADHRRL